MSRMYRQAAELRHREGVGGVLGGMRKWWKWRLEYKPPRAGNV